MDTSAHGLGNRRDTGIFIASEAANIGWHSDRLRQLCRSGDIVRLARGTYLGSDRWSEADPVRRHVLRTAAESLALGPSLLGRVALSHDTAAAWWGLPLMGTPQHGHLTRCGPGGGHRRARYSVHEAYGSGQYDPLTDSSGQYDPLTDSSGCDDPLSDGAHLVGSPSDRSAAVGPRAGASRSVGSRSDVHAANRPLTEEWRSRLGPSPTLAVVPVLAAFGVCQTSGFVAGVVALDGALQANQATMTQVAEWAVTLRHRTGMATIRAAIAAADPGSESPLETQARLMLHALGYRPRSQVTLHTSDGAFVARVDLLIEEFGVVVEVDGRVKYGQPNSTEVVVSEKRRETAIVELGYAVVRLEHHDVMDPPRVNTRIRAAALRAQPHRRLRPESG